MIVLKEYKHKDKCFKSAAAYEISTEVQIVAAFLANQFSRTLEECRELIGQATKMEFLEVKIIHFTNSDGSQRNMTVEQYFANDYRFIRFSNNMKYQLTSTEAEKQSIGEDFVEFVMAFSHWTYKVSVDLQIENYPLTSNFLGL